MPPTNTIPAAAIGSGPPGLIIMAERSVVAGCGLISPDGWPADQVVACIGPAVAAALSGLPHPAATRLPFHAGLSRTLSLLPKGAMDVVLGALLLILAAPGFLAIMAVSSLQGGPIFFAHRRIGALVRVDGVSTA